MTGNNSPEAVARDAARRRRRALADAGYVGLSIDDHDGRQPQTHGTRARYRKGCRCEDCTTQETSYARAHRAIKRQDTNR